MPETPINTKEYPKGRLKKQIVLASGNSGKLREISQLLQNLDMEFIAQADLGISTITETGLSFVENAILKARHAARESGRPAIADDSGISVDSLQGAPGIYSSRFAGVNASDTDNINKLIYMIKPFNEPNLAASFICVVAYLQHDKDPRPVITEGVWQGQLIDTPRGDKGFGYDPIFYIPSQRCTAAELPTEVKNTLSHRGQALKKLRQQLSQP